MLRLAGDFPIATGAIFTFVRSWNDFFWPLIISDTDATRAAPVGLAVFVGRGLSMRFGVNMASAAAATVPAVIFFLLQQRYFLRSISATGLQG